MSFWAISRDDWKIRKGASFLSHLQAGILVASLGPIVSGGQPFLWCLAGVALGVAWEYGYFWVMSSRPQGPRIEVTKRGWPKLGRCWDVVIEWLDESSWRPGAMLQLKFVKVPDRARPRAFDMVPFVLGAGLGLWFSVWRIGG